MARKCTTYGADAKRVYYIISRLRQIWKKKLAQTTQKSWKNVKLRKELYVVKFWDMTPCSLTGVYRHFEVTRCPSFSEIKI
jgi:hypothetical protein